MYARILFLFIDSMTLQTIEVKLIDLYISFSTFLCYGVIKALKKIKERIEITNYTFPLVFWNGICQPLVIYKSLSYICFFCRERNTCTI